MSGRSTMTACDPADCDHARMMPRDPTVRVAETRAAQRRLRRSPDATHPVQGGALIGERDREAFLDILSHELRTPVTTIYGGAELLAKGELKGQRRRALAEDVRV